MRVRITQLKLLASKRTIARKTWFCRVLPLICEFFVCAKAQSQEHRAQEDAVDLFKELKKTVDAVWCRVKERTARQDPLDGGFDVLSNHQPHST
jgi:hypothetical protein